MGMSQSPCLEYIPVQNKLVRRSSMKNLKNYFGVTYYKTMNFIFAVGGKTGSFSVNSVEYYDIERD
jgi:hypothetical protein